MDWRHSAICQFEDPELFFPVGTSGPAVVQIAEAKSVCRRCPVQTDCLTWALESGQDCGVWGGMSEDERRALTRRTARTRTRASPAPRPPVPTHARRPGGTQAENAAAGREALRAGATPEQVAAEFDVTRRTAERWAQRVRTEDAQMAGARQ